MNRIQDKLLPSEDSILANIIRIGFLCWRVGKWLAIFPGILIIYQTVNIVGKLNEEIPGSLLVAFRKAWEYALPLFLELILGSLPYLWLPVFIYILIVLLFKNLFLRKFWNGVAVCGFFLYFLNITRNITWKEYDQLPLLLVQGYLLLLWLLPREIWNLVGLLVSGILGMIILILPDLPSAFDDFGVFAAILTFFLAYLNTIASLVQRAERLIRKGRI